MAKLDGIEPKRSPELLALEDEYGKLLQTHIVQITEPKNAGETLATFVDLSTDAAETYQPTGWVKGRA